MRGKGFNRKGTQRVSQRNAKLQIVEVLYFGQSIHEVTEAEALVASFRVISWIVSGR
jgi:energy-converting hydrogenase Eha subunit F